MSPSFKRKIDKIKNNCLFGDFVSVCFVSLRYSNLDKTRGTETLDKFCIDTSLSFEKKISTQTDTWEFG